MRGDADRVETSKHPNYSLADADMEDEYAQPPPTAEGVVPDAAINHDAGISHDAAHGAPMHTHAPPPSPMSNLRHEIRAQGVKKRLRSDGAEEASKKVKRAVKPMFSSPEDIAALARPQPAAPRPPPAAPRPPPAAPRPPPAAQPVLSGNSAGLSASTSLAPASTAANSNGAGSSGAAVATAAAATAAGLAHGLPTVELQTVGSMEAGQAQRPGQEQSGAGKQLGSAMTGATSGVPSTGVQSAWKPSF